MPGSGVSDCEMGSNSSQQTFGGTRILGFWPLCGAIRDRHRIIPGANALIYAFDTFSLCLAWVLGVVGGESKGDLQVG